MKSYPRIAAKLFSEPWCIRPDELVSMCEQFTAFTRTPRAAADSPVESGGFLPPVEVLGPLALLRLHGVLGKHLSEMEMECGGCDVALIGQQLENFTNDSSIRAIVLDIRSPGGQVTGIQTVVAAIEAFRATGRKAYAYTSEMCASAAYWIASACDEIHAEQSAGVGSISTIIAGVDNSKAWEMEGKLRKVFATGSLKATGMSGKPWTAAEEANIWEKVRTIDADFKAYITARRGLSEDLMQGQWWLAKYAPAGLTDSTAFATLNELLETIYQTL